MFHLVFVLLLDIILSCGQMQRPLELHKKSSIAVTKHLGKATYKDESFILAPNCDSFWPQSFGPLALGPRCPRTSRWECKVEDAFSLMVVGKQTEKEESPSTPLKGTAPGT